MISKKNIFKAIVVLLMFSVLISAYILYPKLNSNKFDVQQLPLSVLSITEKLKSDNLSVQQANVRQSAYTSIDSLIGNPDLQCPDCNVFLIVIDTLRPDHLGVYGYDKNTSPNIDALAEKSFLFTHAFAHSSWTRPSVASILTGMYPAQHGANSMSDKLRNESVTLQEILSENGYATSGFIANFQIERQFGFDQGFDLYDDRDDYNLPEGMKPADCTFNKTTPWLQRCKVGDKYMFFRQGNNNRTAEEINIAFFKWFDKNKDKKMFVYLHYNDPHEPYSPPMPYSKMFFSNNFSNNYTSKTSRAAGSLPLYDGEIAYNDFWIGELIKRLKDEGIYEKSIIVLMADHGEEFAEHNGFGHFRTLYDEVIKIPLMIHTPTTTGKNIIDKQTEAIEVPRYILQLLNIYPKNQSNFQFTVNKEYKDMSYSYLKHEGPWGTELISVRTPQYKYIYNATGDQAVLFAVSDPAERDILKEEPEVVKEMSEYLDWINGLPRITPIKINLSKETKQQLKALGYMN